MYAIIHVFKSNMIYLKKTLVKIYSKLVLTRQDKILFIQPQTHRCTRGHSKFTFYINTNRHIIYAIQHHKIINNIQERNWTVYEKRNIILRKDARFLYSST